MSNPAPPTAQPPRLNRKQRRAANARSRLRQRLAGAGALSTGAAIALGLGLHGSDAHAATFTVTNLSDSGAGSLREAIIAANGAAGADTITFQADLTGVIILTSGQLDVTDSLTITGPGASALSVSGNNTQRVFNVASASAEISVSISGLTITGGRSATGAGVTNANENLTLDGVVVSGNAATTNGGGVWASGAATDLTIRNSTLTGNTATGGGGGIYVDDTGGPVLIEDSTISVNSAANGGGLFFGDPDAVVTIQRVTIADNTASLDGGGLLSTYSFPAFTISRTSIFDNQSGRNGGGVAFLNVRRSLIIENSTISGNIAVGMGGGLHLARPTSSNYYLVAFVRHTTVALNAATGLGGGFRLQAGLVAVQHSLLGDNAGLDASTNTPAGARMYLERTLIESGAGLNYLNYASAGNLFSGDPQLGPLQDNGGPTLTHLPAASSPAVNSGNPGFSGSPTVDQRGFARVNSGVIDVGSVERGNGVFQWSVAAAAAGEAAGTVSLTITRTAGAQGVVGVNYATANGTAITLGDYTAASGTLSWADNDSASKTINVSLIDDNVAESSEAFAVTLSSPTGGASLGATSTVTVTISDDDAAPTISAVSDQTIDEDTVASDIPFTIGDVDDGAGSLTVSATSSNELLVPNASVVLGGSGASRTVTLTPLANQSGATSVTITVSDGINTTPRTFALNVTATNDAPTLAAIADQVIDEDTSTTAIAVSVGDLETAPGSLTMSGSSSDQAIVANSGIVFGGSGASRTVTVTPVAGQSGTVTVTVSVTDGMATTSHSFMVTISLINDSPTISPIADQSTAEDTASSPIALTVGDIDNDPSGLTLSAVSSAQSLVADSGLVFGGSGTSRTLIATPIANRNGTTNVTVTVGDGVSTATQTFALTVTVVNDGPVVSAISNQTIDEDTSTGALAFTIGDVETDADALTVTPNSSDQALIKNVDVVLAGTGSSRSVSVTPLPNQSGTASVSLSVSDGNTTTAQSFTVTVTAVDDVPAIGAIADQVTSEDTPTDPIAFTVGDADTDVNSLTVAATSSNQTLVLDTGLVFGGSGVNRTVTVNPIMEQSGTTDVTVTVSDSTQSTSETFTLTVTTIDDLPTITAPSAQTIDEDTSTGALSFTVGDADDTPASLVVSAASSDQAIVPNANILLGGSAATRSVTISPAANQTGTATVTLMVADDTGNNTAAFDVVVEPVDDSPVLSPISAQSTTEDVAVGPITLTLGDVDTDPNALTLSAVSSNTLLVANADLVLGGSGTSRTLTLTPAGNQNGTANITVSVSDGISSGSQTFALTVSDVDDAPTLSSIADQVIDEDTSTSALAFTIGDAETVADSLTLSATSSNQALIADADLVLSGSGANRTLTITPLAQESGSSTVSVSVSDGVNTTSHTFEVDVTAVNDTPMISALGNQMISEDSATGALSFTIGDVETDADSLTLTAQSSDPSLILDSGIALAGTGASRSVNVSPLPNQSGTATITLIVGDGIHTASSPFTVTVAPLDDAPTIEAIADQITAEDTTTGPIAVAIADLDSPPGTLTISATSSNQTLVTDGGLALGGSGAGTLIVTPRADQSGTTDITISVSDATQTTSETFSLSVTTVDDAPTISALSNQTIDEDTSTTPLGFTLGDVDDDPASLTVTAVSSDQNLIADANLVVEGTGASRTVTATPLANQSGTATVTLTVSDGTSSSSTAFDVGVTTIDDSPVLSSISDQSTPEDTTAGAIAFTIADVDNDPNSLVVSAVSSNTLLVANADLVLDGSGTDRTLEATPLTDQNGMTSITVSVSDGSNTITETYVLTVSAVDDAPTISSLVDQLVNEDTPTPTLTFDIGDVEATTTDLTVTASSSNQALIPDAGLMLSGSGMSRMLAVSPAANESGSSTVTITVSDGVNTSTIAFVVSVSPVDDAPTISLIDDQAIDEDRSTGALEFTIGDLETDPGSLTVTATSSSQGVIADGDIVVAGSGAGRSVEVTPVGEASGTATVTISVSDGTNTSVQQFEVVVAPVDDAPTLSSIADQTTTEDTPTTAIGFSIDDVETDPNSLTLSATSSDQALLEDGDITFSGTGTSRTMTLSPRANQSGSADVTLSVSDGTNTTATTFELAVTSINDAPSITSIDADTILEDTSTAAIEFAIGDADDASDSLTLSAASSNQLLVTNADITFQGTGDQRSVQIAPLANQSGSSDITITVSDGTNSSSVTFALSVEPANDSPTISQLEDQTIDESATTDALAFTLSDVDDNAASLTTTGTSSNQLLVPDLNIVIAGSGADRTVSVTPLSSVSGSSEITISVSDGVNTTTETFSLVVIPPNEAPTISAIADQTGAEDQPSAVIAFMIADNETAASALTLASSSSDLSIVDETGIELGGSGTERTVTVTPLANQSGTSAVTVSVSDGTHVVTETFDVHIQAVDDAPTISAIDDQAIDEDGATEAIAFSIADVDDDVEDLAVTATAANEALLPNDRLVLAGSGENRTLTLSPLANQSGTTQVSVSVSDGANTTTTAFTLEVRPIGDAPVISAIADQTIDENGSTGPVSFSISDVDQDPATLAISATSSNHDLVADTDIAFGGTGATRTVQVTPRMDQDGTTEITIAVSDGTHTASQTFAVMVTASAEADAGVDAGEPDAGASSPADAGITEPDAGHDWFQTGDGCSCNLTGHNARSSRPLLLALLGVIGLATRRRRRSAPTCSNCGKAVCTDKP